MFPKRIFETLCKIILFLHSLKQAWKEKKEKGKQQAKGKGSVLKQLLRRTQMDLQSLSLTLSLFWAEQLWFYWRNSYNVPQYLFRRTALWFLNTFLCSSPVLAHTERQNAEHVTVTLPSLGNATVGSPTTQGERGCPCLLVCTFYMKGTLKTTRFYIKLPETMRI